MGGLLVRAQTEHGLSPQVGTGCKGAGPKEGPQSRKTDTLGHRPRPLVQVGDGEDSDDEGEREDGPADRGDTQWKDTGCKSQRTAGGGDGNQA